MRPGEHARSLRLLFFALLGSVAWAAPGDVLWEDRVDAGIDFGNAVVTDGRRAFATGVSQSGDPEATGPFIRAYDLGSGARSWQRRLGPSGGAPVAAAYGEMVFTGGEGLPVRALDAATGAVRWEDDPGGDLHDVAAGAGLVVVAGSRTFPPPPGGENLDFDYTDLLVRAYDARSGALLWEDVFDSGNLEFDAAYALALGGPRVFVVGGTFGSGGTSLIARAYDARTGSLSWNGSSAAPSVAWAVAARGNQVFVAGQNDLADGSTAPFLAARDARSGALLWEHEVSLEVPAIGGFLDLATTAGEVVAVGSDGRFLVQAHDRLTGRLVWRRSSDAEGRAAGVSALGDQIFTSGWVYRDARDSDWLLEAYESATGRTLWGDRLDAAGSFDLLRANDENRSLLVIVGDVQTATQGSDFLIRAYDAR